MSSCAQQKLLPVMPKLLQWENLAKQGVLMKYESYNNNKHQRTYCTFCRLWDFPWEARWCFVSTRDNRGDRQRSDFRQLATGVLERNCKSISSLFSLSNIMTEWKRHRQAATDIALGINNSCVHILDNYELSIVRQLDLMLLKWRGKSLKQCETAP